MNYCSTSSGVNYYCLLYAFHDVAVATATSFTGGRFLNDLLKEDLDFYNLLTFLGWEIYPKGLYHILKQVYVRYNLPIIIAENGIAQSTDMLRASYIIGHLDHVPRAMAEGGCALMATSTGPLLITLSGTSTTDPSRVSASSPVDRNTTDASSGRKTLDRHITEGVIALQAVIAGNSVREAIEIFGIITPRAYSVSPPFRSAGGVWKGNTNDGVSMTLYISSGNYIGMVFFQDTRLWYRLEDLKWGPRDLTFTFSLRNGTRVRSAVTTANRDSFDGTFHVDGSGDGSGFIGGGSRMNWQVRRQWLCGTWQSSNPQNVPKYLGRQPNGRRLWRMARQASDQTPFPHVAPPQLHHHDRRDLCRLEY